MVDNLDQRAQNLIEQAKKKLKSKVSFNSTVGPLERFYVSKDDRKEEARELLSQAANCFKLQQNWQKAIDCYLQCVEYCSEESEHASYLMDAAHCAKKISASKYLELGRRAINAYSLSGRISSAAGLAKEIAESLEEEYDFEEAVTAYEKAGELYQMEEQTTQANSMVIKASDLRILSRNFNTLSTSIKQYDKVGRKYLTISLIRSSAKDLFFKAILCHMANDDLVGAKRAIQTYQIEDPSFDGSREEKFLSTILKLVQEGGSAKEFNATVADFSRITPLDKVRTTLVCRVKDIYMPEQQIQAVQKQQQQEESKMQVNDEGEPDFT